MKKMNILKKLHDNYLVAVIRGKSEQDAIDMINQIIKGGIYNIEITFTTPNATSVIQHFNQIEDERLLIGAGTVMDSSTASLAIQSGAKYIVSPHYDANIATICNLNAIPYLPGCGSVTEIISALKTGSDVVKLFPGNLLGASFIKDVHGPIPQVALMPSGGVSIDNMHEWYNNGAFAIGIGSALQKGAQDGNDPIIIENTKRFVDKYLEIKG
ncbi:bifunctional 2-keto-4-hydroxyglutarate aldolase/2-keto-3-deoxy-6-phosphogluconate aldolase [Macrococcoides caseolyticum]|uniref:bifunctional 2-keto-4-hydroxyglutarate aldolase/2-keto-3-deoxy-6-phosphogluconate aldolase n=1 Tax=Macrococcoides caseolyticum TaxID=69966 RepID=UPI001F342BBD|nr:bifunctional 2-keto-4-hydroxyglutarate aldolase/2-keto-3-deoxy-6-phosphogluconate aldolase [Macrococcus caseolyticus]MCE4956632.1 bifunctional 2-keto-4-hydroxyglutarate aldolase/2-keto-3-deoxy-6-phosphogluconate aldolase [Macrococcus caseolyticus]